LATPQLVTLLRMSQSNTKSLPGLVHKTARLSEGRFNLAATSLGELVFFGGGCNETGRSEQVYIYNVTNGIWTTTTLSVPRWGLAAASSGNLVFFAGGGNGTTKYSNQVDIYNVSERSWNTAKLSQERRFLAATSVRNLVLFGGGYSSADKTSNVVDIYDVTSNTWTTAKLSQARGSLAATSVANRYALFAGGLTGRRIGTASNVVDIYDTESGTWSTATLSQSRRWLAAASLGNLAFFAGGKSGLGTPSNRVDIFDASTQTWSTATLSEARYGLAAATAGDFVVFGGGTVDKDNSSSTVVDLYCVSNKTWYIARLSEPRHRLVATSVGNKVFFAGGYNRNEEKHSTVVDIFEVPIAHLVANSQQQTHSSSTSNSNSNFDTPLQLRTLHTSLQLLTLGSDISYSDLKLDDRDQIGHGAFGKVYKATYRGNSVAVKKLFVPQELWQSDQIQEDFAYFRKEIEILSLLNHPNIVKCLGGCAQRPHLCIVTEYCNGGSLHDLLHIKKVNLSSQQQIAFALGIAEGMEYLHSRKPMIIHRDLKSQNILLNDNIPKICDFGVSQTKGTLTSALHTQAGTHFWMAPEMMECRPYTEKVDVWSFGMVLYELATNTIPYDYCKDNVPFLTREVCNKKKTPPIPEGQVIDPTLLNLMQQCWNWDPQQRPSFSQIVQTLKDAMNRK
jgi:tRNA A-37 threonylcarbamoyl transferase component Bud32